MNEIWKAVEGYEGFYEVSNQGRVRSLDRKFTNARGLVTSVKGRMLSASGSGYRYAMVGLHRDGKRENCMVHRLVAKAFVYNPNPEEYNVVNHIDHDISNNWASNLEWCTQDYNNKHRVNCLNNK